MRLGGVGQFEEMRLSEGLATMSPGGSVNTSPLLVVYP